MHRNDDAQPATPTTLIVDTGNRWSEHIPDLRRECAYAERYRGASFVRILAIIFGKFIASAKRERSLIRKSFHRCWVVSLTSQLPREPLASATFLTPRAEG